MRVCLLFILMLLLAGVGFQAEACPGCREAMSGTQAVEGSARPHDESMIHDLPRGIYWTVLLMLGVLGSVVTASVVGFWVSLRKPAGVMPGGGLPMGRGTG
jgi:hypothetical protein